MPNNKRRPAAPIFAACAAALGLLAGCSVSYSDRPANRSADRCSTDRKTL